MCRRETGPEFFLYDSIMVFFSNERCAAVCYKKQSERVFRFFLCINLRKAKFKAAALSIFREGDRLELSNLVL